MSTAKSYHLVCDRCEKLSLEDVKDNEAPESASKARKLAAQYGWRTVTLVESVKDENGEEKDVEVKSDVCYTCSGDLAKNGQLF